MNERVRMAFAQTLAIFMVMLTHTANADGNDEPMRTRWAEQVNPEQPLPEYPRPQMVRDSWHNLNGPWQLAVTDTAASRPASAQWEDTPIIVPFPIESTLSSVTRAITPEQALWYRRTFDFEKPGQAMRTLLHFGGVDWHTRVWVNGDFVGEHKGAYDPFTFDITDALRPPDPNDPDQVEQDILIRVWDPTDDGFQPRGKQVLKPGGIWYTAVTGIWQTIWLEYIPESSIERLKLTPDVDAETLTIEAPIRGPIDNRMQVRVQATMVSGLPVALQTSLVNMPITLKINRPRLWSPDDPFLYDLEVTLMRDGQPIDSVTSYFAFRKVEVRKADDGFMRIHLNNKPLFMLGPLDQGWWPDGLYTAPTDGALRFDVEMTKQLGFNMCRKHVKVEPARWYYWCDKVGLMVWQDMPSGDRYIGGNDPDMERSAESEANFRHEWQAIIESYYNHPSIVCWVPFNEGWGQFKTNEILDWTKSLDATRLVDGPSGWADRGGGDLIDKHSYPGPDMFPAEDNRASVLGEFGGLGLAIPGHLWQEDKNWGYRSYDSKTQLQSEYDNLIQQLRPLIARGLSAAVYTQTTDVETEVNGIFTYDRKIIKLDRTATVITNDAVHRPPPKVTVIVPASQEEKQTWRYTTAQPTSAWMAAEYDDSSWTSGPGGFGTAHTPGSVVGTEWNTNTIWLRRTFLFDEKTPLDNLFWRVHHDEDIEIFLNGTSVFKREGYITSYRDFPLGFDGVMALRRGGENTIAVKCTQTGGGQFVDVGIVHIVEDLGSGGRWPGR